MIENVNVSIKFIASKVKLQGISAEGLFVVFSLPWRGTTF